MKWPNTFQSGQTDSERGQGTIAAITAIAVGAIVTTAVTYPEADAIFKFSE